ncbi:MAG: type II toxin-antitoxin system VapC family toxin [Candidatus Micrarchaeota archaeon]|nr:type II toxin-antitoxin system VapC family toxin [Candidatus Micrarchaeota archaeon]
MILLDADFLIAYFRENDQQHNRAVEIMKSVNETTFVTTSIINEIFTYIKARDGGKKTREVWEWIKNSDIEIIEINRIIEEIIYYVEKFDGLSFGDASNIAIMKQLGIERIVSFDSDFDIIPGIRRIY